MDQEGLKLNKKWQKIVFLDQKTVFLADIVGTSVPRFAKNVYDPPLYRKIRQREGVKINW